MRVFKCFVLSVVAFASFSNGAWAQAPAYHSYRIQPGKCDCTDKESIALQYTFISTFQTEGACRASIAAIASCKPATTASNLPATTGGTSAQYAADRAAMCASPNSAVCNAFKALDNGTTPFSTNAIRELAMKNGATPEELASLGNTNREYASKKWENTPANQRPATNNGTTDTFATQPKQPEREITGTIPEPKLTQAETDANKNKNIAEVARLQKEAETAHNAKYPNSVQSWGDADEAKLQAARDKRTSAEQLLSTSKDPAVLAQAQADKDAARQEIGDLNSKKYGVDLPAKTDVAGGQKTDTSVAQNTGSTEPYQAKTYLEQKEMDYAAADAKHSETKSALQEKRDENVRHKDERIANRQARQDERQAKKDVKAARNVSANDVGAIQEDNDANNKDCGIYGGASCKTTQAINMGAMLTEQAGTIAGALHVSNAGTKANDKVMNMGMNATTSDYADAQIAAAKAAKRTEATMMTTDATIGAMQVYRMAKHGASSGKIAATAGAARFQLQQELAACGTDTACAADVQRRQKNVSNNQGIESKRQKEMNEAQMMAVMMTAGNVAKHAQGMMAANAAMKTLEAQKQNVTDAPQFRFDPGGVVQNNYDPTLQDPQVETGAIVDQETFDDQFAGGEDPGINPGFDGGLPGGPAPGGFDKDNNYGKGPGSGSSGGVGSAAGTSAAKDTMGAEGSGPSGKASGGAYAEGGSGSGGKFGRNGAGGAGVGVDSAFADLLKKFLPGDDEKKDSLAELNMGDEDRSPASDKAAVIGRNKNIFEEVHKRYQKKGAEGAVVF